MKCDIKTPLSVVADVIRKTNIKSLMQGKLDSIEEAVNRLDLFTNSFQIRFKDASLLRNKKLPTQDGKVRVYGVIDQDADVEESFTAEGKIKFTDKVGPERAAQLSKEEESIIKKESGTAVHAVLEGYLNLLATTEFKDSLVLPNSKKAISETEIKKLLSLPDPAYEGLKKTARELIKQNLEIQSKIDAKGKMIISTEQILGDGNLMGTADVLFIYSDFTASHYDFKTIAPKSGVERKGGKASILRADWIPFYKYEDWNLQLPKTTNALKNIIGVKSIRQSRVIPIQLEFEFVKGKITEKIKQIESFATAEDFLDQVPVQEKVEPELDSLIQKLDRRRSNLIKELSEIKGVSPKKDSIKKRISELTVVINKLIVKQDNRYIINEYERVIKKYADIQKGVLTLKNVNDPTDEDLFLDKKDMMDLMVEVETMQSIIAVTGGYLHELGISEEEIDKWENRRIKVQANLSTLASILKQELYKSIDLKTTTLEELKNAADVSMLAKLFDTFSEIDHPAFREAYNSISKASNEKRLALQKFKNKLNDEAVALEEYSKKTGLGLFGVYDLLINKASGNLYGKYSKEFYEGLKKSQEEKDKTFIDKYFKLKPDAQKKLDEYISKQEKEYDLTNEYKKKQFQNFKNENTLENIKFKSNALWFYYEPKPETLNEIYSSEYNKITSTPELKRYYDFWTESMKEFRGLFGIFNDYTKIPENFIPNYRADLVENMFRDGFLKATWEHLSASFKATQDDQAFGETSLDSFQDVNTGEVLSQIPKWGLNPIRNKNGYIDKNLKSYDLTKVLYTFAEVAYNYDSMSKIQADMDILSMMIAEEGLVQKTQDGKIITTLGGQYSKLTGESLELLNLFKQHIKYSLYGIKDQTNMNKDVAKTLMTANQMYVFSKLALSPVTQVAASLSAKINQYYEGVKGYYYSKSNMKDAEKDLSKALTEKGELTRALLGYFELSDKHSSIIGTELPSNKILNLSQRGLSMIGFRKGSEWIDNSIGLAMLRNYGIDAEGNVRRLSITKGKSLYERASIKNGELTIEGLNIQGYTQFRNIVRQVSRSIKGELTEGDQRSIQMSVYGKMFMTFKSWLPDLVKERFGSIKYRGASQEIVVGRLNAIWKNSDISIEEKKWYTIIGEVLLKASQLLLDVVTFGGTKQFKVNEARISQLLAQYKAENPNNEQIQNYSEEDFKDYMQGQIRAGITEIRTYLAFIALVLAFGADWDDDGKEDWKSNMATRFVYRNLNRIRRELGFFYGSEGVSILTKNSVPLSGALVDLISLTSNTFDESRDLFVGENSPYDKSDQFHYTLKFIPGARPFIDLFVLDETAEKKEN